MEAGTHFKQELCQLVTSFLESENLYHQQLAPCLLKIESEHKDCHVTLKFAVNMPQGDENIL
jgi:hypothetical protein